jgi:hypothetical protein
MGEDGVVRVQIDAGSFRDLESAKADLAVVREIAGASKVPVLVDLRRIDGATRDARSYCATGEAAAGIAAAAVLVDAPISKVLGNFFVGVSKPPYPARLFTDQTEALGWLMEFLS